MSGREEQSSAEVKHPLVGAQGQGHRAAGQSEQALTKGSHHSLAIPRAAGGLVAAGRGAGRQAAGDGLSAPLPQGAPLAPQPAPRCRQLAGRDLVAAAAQPLPAPRGDAHDSTGLGHSNPPGPEAKCSTPRLWAGQRVQAPKAGGVLVSWWRQLGQPGQHAAVGAGGGDLQRVCRRAGAGGETPATRVATGIASGPSHIQCSYLWEALPHPVALKGRVRHLGANPTFVRPLAAATPRRRPLTDTLNLLRR